MGIYPCKYIFNMHKKQALILDLAGKENLGNLTLREIGSKIGEKFPQTVKHHLEQLKKKGYLKENKIKGTITKVINQKEGDFLSIPILGYANCGQALSFAEEGYEGFLQLSKSILPKFDMGKTFAVRAIGNSMNNAEIGENKKRLSEGDYAIIDTSKHNIDFYNKKYVLSVIDGMANIKKLVRDDSNKMIKLVSESTHDYPPILISYKDLNDFSINGEVVSVISA